MLGQTLGNSGVSSAPSLSSTDSSASPAGTYAVSVALGTLTALNYTFAGFSNGTLSVLPVTLTVTAANASRTYGAADPTFTANYSGFVLGQTLGNSGASSAPSLTSTDSSTSPVGSYTIAAAQGSLAAQNYAFTFANGTLSVTRATPTVTVSDTGGTYCAQSFPAAALVAGVISGVDSTPASSLEGFSPTLTYYTGSGTGGNSSSAAPSAGGTYTVVASFPGSADYFRQTAARRCSPSPRRRQASS